MMITGKVYELVRILLIIDLKRGYICSLVFNFAKCHNVKHSKANGSV